MTNADTIRASLAAFLVTQVGSVATVNDRERTNLDEYKFPDPSGVVHGYSIANGDYGGGDVERSMPLDIGGAYIVERTWTIRGLRVWDDAGESAKTFYAEVESLRLALTRRKTFGGGSVDARTPRLVAWRVARIATVACHLAAIELVTRSEEHVALPYQ